MNTVLVGVYNMFVMWMNESEWMNEPGEHTALSAYSLQADLPNPSINQWLWIQKAHCQRFIIWGYQDSHDLFRNHSSEKNKPLNPEHFPENVFIKSKTKRKWKNWATRKKRRWKDDRVFYLGMNFVRFRHLRSQERGSNHIFFLKSHFYMGGRWECLVIA